MDEDRIKHSISVARKMVEIAKINQLSDEEIKNCFIIGFPHDIGYEFTENGIDHNIIGGEILKNVKVNIKMYKKLKIKMYKIFNQFCIGSVTSESIFILSFNR